MTRVVAAGILCAVAWATLTSPLLSQEISERIATPEEIREATSPGSLTFLHALHYPYRKFTGGMERGMVYFEKRKLRERYNQWLADLRQAGVTLKFGGMGQGSGFGGGGIYEFRPAESQSVRLLALATFKNYQEGDLQYQLRLPHTSLFTEASYQWRPQENYYGEGHRSRESDHTSFAMRQSWTGARLEIYPWQRLGFGVLHRFSWVAALPGNNTLLPVFTGVFPGAPGYLRETRLQSTGAYIFMDGIRDEYRLGGAAHLGASYQHSFAGGNVRYLSLESQLEGRLPVKQRNSILVGQANIQLNRERRGSDPIPFYLQPRIGGSSTFRGYALDRFYGRNLACLSIEYRIRIHPNIQFYPFHDGGQIFDHSDDLSWTNWHRSFGFGFRYLTVKGTVMRVDLGWGGEGAQLHILFGDREQPALRNPIRHGVYKR